MVYLVKFISLPFVWLGLFLLLIGTLLQFGVKLTALIFKGLSLSIEAAIKIREKEKQ